MLNKTAISVLYINYNYKKMKLINSPISVSYTHLTLPTIA